ncbi:hypothetical protein BS47DRAFT_1347680 [Hydnum rufescens UP504]|uniref:Uncharacterized protein n=1 Tax=Hydnum rufescens UP504 TaxID=1448309 RepID=A0A9P6ASE0_9AGAM|nr:hypothetical protein BS47DRAFT_1347680 [Hydnum rufescens UP504]
MHPWDIRIYRSRATSLARTPSERNTSKARPRSSTSCCFTSISHHLIPRGQTFKSVPKFRQETVLEAESTFGTQGSIASGGLNEARPCQVMSRHSGLVAHSYDTKPAFELFGDSD